jgi:leader peptidase (prepilin peptidase) / N-methyltransferase
MGKALLPHWFYILFFFTLGSCIGSFLNVVVYRLPRGQSLVHPPSRCPQCEHKLAWYDNLPVIGWVLLRGRCRYCKKPISPRYPIVEAITGLLFAGFYAAIFIARQGPFWVVPNQTLIRMEDLAVDWPIFGLYLFSVSCLLAASLIDAELYLIPAPLPLLMAGAGILVHGIVDRPMLPGSLTASAPRMALAAGASLGLILSIVLLRLKILPLSFSAGESPLEVDKLRQREKKDEEDLPDYTPKQVRAEIRKEMLFLLAPLVLGGLSVILQMDGRPLHSFWQSAQQLDWLSGLLGSLLGGLVGGFVVWFTRILGSYALGKEAMGLGDIDLMFGVGAVIGAGAATVAFLMAPFFGLPLAIGMFLFKSRRQLPYGPYLSIATAVVMLFYFPIYDYLRPGLLGLAALLRDLI